MVYKCVIKENYIKTNLRRNGDAFAGNVTLFICINIIGCFLLGKNMSLSSFYLWKVNQKKCRIEIRMNSAVQ